MATLRTVHATTLLRGFDDVTISLLDPGAAVVFYYADGNYAEQEAAIRRQCPHAILVPISIDAGFVVPRSKRLFLDMEPTLATIGEFGGWHRLAKSHGVELPGGYCSVSSGEEFINAAEGAGLRYGVDFLWWSAHYTDVPHLCSPACGFGVTHVAHDTQWTDRAEGKSLDGDLCTPLGVGLDPKPAPHSSGIALFAGAYDITHDHWTVRGAPGHDVKLVGAKALRKAEISLEIGHGGGAWNINRSR